MNCLANFKTLGFLACLLALSVTGFAAGERVKVEAVGQAAIELPNARESAIEDALRRSVEAGGGVEVASLSQTSNFQLVKDVIYTKTAGLVESYEILQENPDQDGLYTVKLSAIISRGSINSSIEAFKALLRRKGHPRMIVVGWDNANGSDKKPFQRRLATELQSAMEKHNLTVIDLDGLSANQRDAAERAARSDLDPKMAALIAKEVRCDYFVVAAIEGSQHAPTNSYGINIHKVDSTAILKVVAADSAKVIAAEVVTISSSARDSATALREATKKSLLSAFEKCVGRIGANWLSDVDSRGGAQITLILRKASFERVSSLCRTLRADPGIKDVIVDSTDAEGRSFVRVITNESAANIAAFVSQADPGMKIRSTSAAQVEMEAASSASPFAGQRGISPKALTLIVLAAIVIIMILYKLLIGRARQN